MGAPVERRSQVRGPMGLTESALDALLKRLHHDPEKAADEYETIRRKLTLFFGMRVGDAADTLADATFDRVARKLDQGEVVASVPAFFYGVARYVLMEWQRRTAREVRAAQGHTFLPNDEAELREARIDCLKHCLDRLPADDRELILAYYSAGRGTSEDGKKDLAARLGLSYGNLKIRAHRIRRGLEGCLTLCLAAEDRGPSAPTLFRQRR